MTFYDGFCKRSYPQIAWFLTTLEALISKKAKIKVLKMAPRRNMMPVNWHDTSKRCVSCLLRKKGHFWILTLVFCMGTTQFWGCFWAEGHPKSWISRQNRHLLSVKPIVLFLHSLQQVPCTIWRKNKRLGILYSWFLWWMLPRMQLFYISPSVAMPCLRLCGNQTIKFTEFFRFTIAY